MGVGFTLIVGFFGLLFSRLCFRSGFGSWLYFCLGRFGLAWFGLVWFVLACFGSDRFCVVGWLVDWLIGWLVGWPVSLAGRLVGHLTYQHIPDNR